ncbi:MAG TPA: hypothetical protein VMM79_04765 [Longimicrobiales bacterium]|nr:hypothetical protein [Longimicrobiales bacterium]
MAAIERLGAGRRALRDHGGTGGDAGITQSLSNFHRERVQTGAAFMGLDGSLIEYVGKAMLK